MYSIVLREFNTFIYSVLSCDKLKSKVAKQLNGHICASMKEVRGWAN